MSTPTSSTQPVFLLDVNVLLALFDPMHVHHAAIRHWFASGPHAVATCPLSQLGFVRICSNPRYPNALDSPDQALGLLRALHKDPRHVFWPDEVSLATDVFSLHPFRSHRETTDRYLVHLAATRGGRLLTLDAGIKPANTAERAALCLVTP